ncbi:hypothetical protein [uncultured Desulfovibrio sp.]|uniref:hypothetical protein n=1 Tax=uncultured Desulfovibrio sp. TaxID=167968 RepID=UPI00262CFC26|nr:hypothetical protein [uncultured Desulfovibrio sp.]
MKKIQRAAAQRRPAKSEQKTAFFRETAGRTAKALHEKTAYSDFRGVTGSVTKKAVVMTHMSKKKKQRLKRDAVTAPFRAFHL